MLSAARAAVCAAVISMPPMTNAQGTNQRCWCREALIIMSRRNMQSIVARRNAYYQALKESNGEAD